MNPYTVNGYTKGWIKGCPKCGGYGVLVINPYSVEPDDLYYRVCVKCKHKELDEDWEKHGKSWDGDKFWESAE